MISVSSKHGIVLGMPFCALPGIADRSALTSAVAIHAPLWKNMFNHMWLALAAHLTHENLLDLKS